MRRNISFCLIFFAFIGVGLVTLDPVSAQKDELTDSSETNAPQSLPFTQNWTNAAMITANDDWSGVAGVVGFLGDYDAASPTNVDARTLTAPFTTNNVDVIANATAPDTLTSGGVAEFDTLTNPVIALNGSGTADAPHIVLYVNTTGRSSINLTANLRDLDGSADDATQQVNIQYRVGGAGNFTNVTGGYFADVTTTGTATQVTPVNVTLPADANNQAQVEIRILTTNAGGNDEWVGVDDISVTGVAAGASPTPTPSPSPSPSASPGGTTPRSLFTSRLSGAQEVPANSSTGRGYGRVVLNAAQTEITASFYWEGLGSGTISGHIHGPAAVGVNAGVLFNMNPTTGLTSGSTVDRTFAVTPAQVADLRAGLWYFNIHTTNFTGGEIRGQIVSNLNDAPFDINGDGRTDFGVVRRTGAVGGTQVRWHTLINGTPASKNQTDFGVASDSLTPGDFDGDGKDDIAIWRSEANNSTFYILQSTTNTLRTVRFGIPNDDPFVISDYDGDGIDDPAIFRKGGTDSEQSFFWWYGSYGITKNAQVPVAWGVGADVAVPGDFNGDGKADFCVYRGISNRGLFFIHYGTGGFDATSPSDTTTRFGLPSDAVVPGDYDGDGKTDFAVTRFEGANLAWYFLPSSGGTVIQRLAWGRNATDIEVQGDYDGDGITDRAVWRSTPGNPAQFFILRSSNQTVQYELFGQFDDVPAAQDSHL